MSKTTLIVLASLALCAIVTPIAAADPVSTVEGVVKGVDPTPFELVNWVKHGMCGPIGDHDYC